MSKSLGNVVDPIELADRYGVDALRYFFMREVSFGQDGTWSEEAIVTRCNAELANSFGNLAQRVLSLIYKNLDGILPKLELSDEDLALLLAVNFPTRDTIRWNFSNLEFSQGIAAWMGGVFACNAYVDAQAPWALRKSSPERMKAVLGALFLCIRDLAIAIRPVIPESADKLLDQMGIPIAERDYAALAGDTAWYERLRNSNFLLKQPTGVFPRLELPAEAAV